MKHTPSSTYYDSCEDAVRAMAARNYLGVTLYLQKAAMIRDTLVARARARLEFEAVREVLGYWECTLISLTYASRSGRAAMVRDADLPKAP